MFYIKRFQSEQFTVRNINGDILSKGKDPDHSYIICLQWLNEECGLSFGSSYNNTLNAVKCELEMYGPLTISKYTIKYGLNNVTHFETEKDAQDVLDYMMQHPNEFIRSSLW